MYISKIYLDTRRHEAARAIYNPEILHGALEQSFEGDRQHPLWRLDNAPVGHGAGTFLLVVSKDKPDFSTFQEQFGFCDKPAQIKDYDPFLQKGFREGDFLRFRIVANPTIKVAGKRVPLNAKSTERYPYNAVDWICDRLKNNGARVVSVQLNSYGRKSTHGKNKKVRYVQAVYDGILQVEDREKLANVLKNGIGHEKAYGCGLVSVMRI